MRSRVIVPVVLLAAAAVAAGALAATSGREIVLLPDLDAAVPSEVQVRTVGGERRRFHLSFESAADNVGAGPLFIEASRPNTSSPRMAADQVVSRSDGSTFAIRGVGVVRYVVEPSHQHWHLLRAMAYELRTLDGQRVARRDAKTGFCLGDRYETDDRTDLPGEPPGIVYDFNCGFDGTDLLSIEQGISVGYGDNYEPWRDGQYIDVTNLAAGRYVLVHRVNPDRRLREAGYGNNASSLLLRLSWPQGRAAPPRIQVLGACPDQASCWQS